MKFNSTEQILMDQNRKLKNENRLLRENINSRKPSHYVLQGGAILAILILIASWIPY